MEKLTDKEILKNVIDALGVKKPEFRKKLKYNSNTTIYNIFNEVHGISNDMINRIIQAYPEVNYLYLKRGVGKPLKADSIASKNIIDDKTPDELTVNELLTLPKRIEKLEELVATLQNQINNLIEEKK